jgi:3-oxoacyl-[acyl-carrier protein] reductase
VRINAIAPGFVVTDIHQATLEAGPHRAGAAYFERTEAAIKRGGGDPPMDAAELTAFLLSDASEGITGRLISARWDPWRETSFQQRLRVEKDLATIRRIDEQFFTAMGPQ